jgi:flavin reductase (DIM6/NTAB) family NADH-FMN oxidoreductase RutF
MTLFATGLTPARRRFYHPGFRIAPAREGTAPSRRPHAMTHPGHAAGGPRPDFTARDFRDALSEFATGVTIIATRESATRYAGFTANSFNSVSLVPPLVVWSLARDSNTLPAFVAAERYAISVLAHDQVDLALRFSRPHADRFDGVAYTLGWADAPLITGAVAWFECRHFRQVEAGDHMLFMGEVAHCQRRPGQALVFHQGRFQPTARPAGA